MRVLEQPAGTERPWPVFQVLSEFGIPFTVNGRGWVEFLCPFHDERTPSCAISLDSGWYTCLGCGASGSFLDFVSRLAKTGDDLQALRIVRRLRERPVPDEVSMYVEHGRSSGRSLRRSDIMDRWMRFHKVDWRRISLNHPVARYLIVQRELSRRILDAFDVRLTDRADYPVVFPIYMGKGNLVGYVYRRIDKVQRRKYLYPKHLRIGSIVAYYEVERGPLVLVEGIMDFMKVAQFGCSRAAAIFSWRITAAQAAWLKEQGVKSVICALDNTPTGEEGCERLKRFFPHVVRFRFQGKHRKDIGELNVNEYAWGLP